MPCSLHNCPGSSLLLYLLCHLLLSETRNARVIQQITKEQKERRNCCRSCWDSFKIVCMCLCVTGQREQESHRWAAVKKRPALLLRCQASGHGTDVLKLLWVPAQMLLASTSSEPAAVHGWLRGLGFLQKFSEGKWQRSSGLDGNPSALFRCKESV